MAFHTIDFGKGIVPVNKGDALFLDTNVIIAYLYEHDERHLACYCLITYLLKNDVYLLVSETSAGEVVNSLARILYADEEFKKHVSTIGSEPSVSEKSELSHKFRRWWIDKIVKKSAPELGEFNGLAIDKFEPLLSVCYFNNSSEIMIKQAFEISRNTPLQSADAMIVGSALSDPACVGLISIDGDMEIVTALDVYKTSIKNQEYNTAFMIKELDIKEYLIENIGEDDFIKKFGGVD